MDGLDQTTQLDELLRIRRFFITYRHILGQQDKFNKALCQNNFDFIVEQSQNPKIFVLIVLKDFFHVQIFRLIRRSWLFQRFR